MKVWEPRPDGRDLTAGSADETKNPDAKTVSRAPAAKWKKMRLLRAWKCGRRGEELENRKWKFEIGRRPLEWRESVGGNSKAPGAKPAPGI